MSLLNDALRDLERRQADGRPSNAAVPASLCAGGTDRQSRLAVVVGLVLIVLAVGLFVVSGGYGLDDDAAPATVERLPDLEGENTVLPRSPDLALSDHPLPFVSGPAIIETAQDGANAADVSDPEIASGSSPDLLGPESEQAMTAPVFSVAAIAPQAEERGVSTSETAVAPGEQGPQKRIVVEPKATSQMPESDEHPRQAASTPEIPLQEPTPLEKAEDSRAELIPANRTNAERASASVNSGGGIKQRPQSAEARDQRLIGDLERMLVEGQESAAAEALETAVAEGFSMPRSHASMARYYLAQQRLDEARRWLPESLVAAETDLRLLRGRLVLLEQGPNDALSYLGAEIPNPARAPDYIATLAALYQQTGQYAAAGEQWVALLETNSRRAEWWLGLGLALDSQDQLKGAEMAYAEALALPDMSPRLRSFAQSRLDGLR